MEEQIRALRSTISKKQERKPPFFLKGPPETRGASKRDMGGAEPKLPNTDSNPTQRKGQHRGKTQNSIYALCKRYVQICISRCD